MAAKQLDLPDIGKVTLYKRRNSRRLKISLDEFGGLRVSMPNWTPYKAAIGFVYAQKDWILEQQSLFNKAPLKHGQAIGKAHHLAFIPRAGQKSVATRIVNTEIRVFHEPELNILDKNLQALASKACQKALKAEADQLLPMRLRELAQKHGFEYSSVKTRQLKSRWGSCNQNKDITLNFYLMQLPWHLIDYVILHELTHTKVMRHGPPFWAELEKHLPGARKLRKDIVGFRPNFNSQI